MTIKFWPCAPAVPMAICGNVTPAPVGDPASGEKLVPPFVDRRNPLPATAMNTVDGLTGSSATSVTVSDRRRVQVTPPLLVTSRPASPQIQTCCGFVGSTTSLPIRRHRQLLRSDHVVPPFVVTYPPAPG